MGGEDAGRGGGNSGGGVSGAGGISGGGSDSGAGEGGDSGAGGEPAECDSNDDCRLRGFEPPNFCIRGRCVDAKSDDCPVLIGGGTVANHEEAILFGAFGHHDPVTIGAHPAYLNMALAISDFQDLGGIPIDGRNRKPVIVLCLASTPTLGGPFGALDRSLEHLVGELGVPGILMLTTTTDVEYAAKNGGETVFMIHDGGANQRLLNLEDDDLVWHMLGSDSEIARTYVPLVERAEQHVNPGSAVRPTRLVLAVTHDSAFKTDMAALLVEMLQINGGLAAGQVDAGNFAVVEHNGMHTETAVEIASHEPDIVVDLNNSSPILPMIDTEMTRRGAPLPFYVLSPFLSASTNLTSLASQPSFRERVVGVNYAGAVDRRLVDLYLQRLQLFPRKTGPDPIALEGTENVYDATYFLFLAAAASGGRLPFDGGDLARGMRRLIDDQGQAYDIGPLNLNAIFAQLASAPDATLKFYGTLGAPDFDASGGRSALGSVWCLDAIPSYAYDELRFDRMTNELYGRFTCFDF
jgi:hypothetical protein